MCVSVLAGFPGLVRPGNPSQLWPQCSVSISEPNAESERQPPSDILTSVRTLYPLPRANRVRGLGGPQHRGAPWGASTLARPDCRKSIRVPPTGAPPWHIAPRLRKRRSWETFLRQRPGARTPERPHATSLTSTTPWQSPVRPRGARSRRSGARNVRAPRAWAPLAVAGLGRTRPRGGRGGRRSTSVRSGRSTHRARTGGSGFPDRRAHVDARPLPNGYRPLPPARQAGVHASTAPLRGRCDYGVSGAAWRRRSDSRFRLGSLRPRGRTADGWRRGDRARRSVRRCPVGDAGVVGGFYARPPDREQGRDAAAGGATGGCAAGPRDREGARRALHRRSRARSEDRGFPRPAGRIGGASDRWPRGGGC